MFRKLFSLLTIILMTASPAAAQDNEVAAAAALDSVIRIFSHYDIVDNFVDEVFKKHKKSASMATRIAKSYYSFVENPETRQRTYYRRDLPRAFSYIDKALAINPKYSKAYIVASDIFFNEAKLDTAQMWLDKGIAVNPTDSALYIESAKLLAFTDPDAAVKKLMVLKQRDSTFQVDLQLGRLYYRLYDKHGKTEIMNEMAQSYDRVYDSNDRDKLTLGDLQAYGLGLQWAADMGDARFEKLYEITAYGLERYSGDYSLQRSHLLGCMNTKRYDEGIAATKIIYAMPDSAQAFKDEDCLWYATCLAGAKRYADAISEYERVLAMEGATANRKTQAESAIVNTVRSQVKELTNMGDYDKAVAIIEPIVQRYRDKDKQNDFLMIAYATIYTDWAAELNGVERMDAIRNAVKVFDEAANHSELNVNMFLQRCCYYSMALDPELKDGLGMPYAQKLVENLGGKKDLEASEKNYLLLGYEYMLRHEYFIKKNKKAALVWANRMLDVDEMNEMALNFISKVK